MRYTVDFIEFTPTFPRIMFSKYEEHNCHTVEDAYQAIREHGELYETKRMWSGHPAITTIRGMTKNQLPENTVKVVTKKNK